MSQLSLLLRNVRFSSPITFIETWLSTADFVSTDQPVVTKLKKLRVNVADFEEKKVIGRGHFGQVHLVKEKQTGDVFAMKVMKKTETLAKINVINSFM